LSRGVFPVGFTRISSLLTVRATGVSDGVFGLDANEDAADGVLLLGWDAAIAKAN
jgi:hypothetical protein